MEGTVSTDTGSTTTGPATFSDASLSWSEDSSASTPDSSGTAAASASTDATDPSAATPDTNGSTPAAGEPPRERWDAILANARQKASEEALSAYQGLQGVTPAQWQSFAPWLQRYASDPEGFLVGELADHPEAIGVLQKAISRLQANPQHAQTLKSLAARALSARTAQQGPDLTPINVQLEGGQVVPLYSADQIAALKTQWLSEVEQKFQPVTQTIETLQAREAAAQQQQQIDHFVTTTFADVQTWPGMDDKANQAAVGKYLAERKVESNDPREVQILVNEAYRKVVLPKLSQNAQSQLLDTLKTKAAASTSVNPGSAASTAPRKVTSFHDSSLQW